MSWNESKKIYNEIKNLFDEIQINLENNYKDLAITARKKAEKMIEDNKGNLSKKHFDKLKKQLDEYTERMKGYHH